ncbi:hypothetical protein RND81_14G139000 [Saponaria officinalis]|uniref:BZIP domain-containing protein n=1 Tax=Saponaria officinalis TaxID=3572 RepID=A0AAW1GLJ5_SAPOF
MAKLPPKIPSILSQCNDDEHHNQWVDLSRDNLEISPPEHHTQQPWVDEFMEYSAAKRTSHRRSVSESSVAFIEAGTIPFLSPGPLFRVLESGDGVINKGDDFDKFDDEQFMCMFSNDVGGASSTSDHNSTNEDQKRRSNDVAGDGSEKADEGEVVIKAVAASVKNEAEEVESSCNVDKDGVLGQGSNGNAEVGNNGNVGECCGSDQQQMVDPKRFKRILANRQSAQRSRVRKLQYISELEHSVTSLQNEVSILSPRVAFLDHQRMLLSVDNSALKAKIAALAQDKIFKDGTGS